MGDNDYQILTAVDTQRIRRERIFLIESDLCRARLQLEEAQSAEERQAVLGDISALCARLQPHYQALGMIQPAEEANGD